MRSRLLRAGPLALLALLAMPASAFATNVDLKQAVDGKLPDTVAINTHVGGRHRRARAVHAGGLRDARDRLLAREERRHGRGEDPDQPLDRRHLLLGGRLRVRVRHADGSASRRPDRDNGFFLQGFGDPQQAFFPSGLGLSDATIESKWLFQFAFCAVSLAIVWGTTLERIKYGAYVIYAIVFASIIYPIGSHWVFGGGWLQNGERRSCRPACRTSPARRRST